MKFHENLSSGIQIVPCGRTDEQTDMLKIILAFCNFVNMPIIELKLVPNYILYKKFQQNRKLLII